MNAHVIQKQTIDFTMGRGLDKFQVQHQMSSYYKHIIIKALEEVFDELSQEEQIKYFDRIELDIGTISSADLEKFSGKEEIKKVIQKQMAGIESNQSESIFQQSTYQNAFEKWLYFLKSGIIPWNSVQSFTAIVHNALIQLRQQKLSVEKLKKSIVEFKNVPRRLVYQHSERTLMEIAYALGESHPIVIKQTVEEMHFVLNYLNSFETNIKTLDKQSFKQELWIIAFQNKAKGKYPSVNQMLQYLADLIYLILGPSEGKKLIRKIENKIPSIATKLIKQMDELSSRKILLSIEDIKHIQVFEQVIPGLELRKFLSAREGGDIDVISMVGEITESTKTKQSLAFESELLSSIEHDNQRLQFKEKEGMYVELAGLVLIHPFLSNFFDRLRFLKQQKFVNERARERAIHLLYYLATGEQNPEEFQLIIPKIICNCPIEYPVRRIKRLRKNERAEAKDLLNAVIANWSILKSTSTSTIQDDFLQRGGKLYTESEKLRLKVENHSIDVLLSYLSWNISIVKLPWKREILRVEWR